ncbi:MAG: hypothetical protein AAF311_04595 [Pseudomonadota bacterium]
MTDPSDKPSRTLADMIPEEPERRPRSKQLDPKERERLEALERAVRDTEPDALRKRSRKRRGHKSDKSGKAARRKRGGSGRFFLWSIIILCVLVVLLD